MTGAAAPAHEDAERQDALRHLLRYPLMTDAAPHTEAFRLVRRHRDRIGRDLRQLLGYRLVVEATFARLYKAGLGPGRGRPLRRGSGAPFTPRTYAYLALCCSVLVAGRKQVLLSALAESVRSAAAEAGIDLGEDSHADRRAFVAALRQLVAWGVWSRTMAPWAPLPTTPAPRPCYSSATSWCATCWPSRCARSPAPTISSAWPPSPARGRGRATS